MKKIFAIALVCLTVATSLSAQDKAIGLKLTNGIEVSGQMALSDANRAEANIRWVGSGIGVNGYYQWVQDLPKLGADFKWFYGAGGAVYLGGGFGLGVGGQVGLEYDLSKLIKDVPLQLTLDVTPTIRVVGGFDYLVGGGLGIRYKF